MTAAAPRRFPPRVVAAIRDGQILGIRAGTRPHRVIGIWAVVVEGRVFVRCRSVNSNVVRVSVTDTGPGIDEGAEELVFEPFYTTKREGMGMGLSIVRTILESHGGTIRALNNGRQGAQFEFTLPAIPEHQLQEQSAS